MIRVMVMGVSGQLGRQCQQDLPKHGFELLGLGRDALDVSRGTEQDWRTKSGKPSLETGERYLPAAAIESLTPAEYAATSRAKRAGMRKGVQFVEQPERIAKKVSRFRR